MLRRLLTATLIAVPTLFVAARAAAAIVGGSVTFSVPNAGPINPFAGSFDVTFDNSADILTDTTAGPADAVLPFGLSAGVSAFRYFVDFSGTPDVIVLGGTQNNANKAIFYQQDSSERIYWFIKKYVRYHLMSDRMDREAERIDQKRLWRFRRHKRIIRSLRRNQRGDTVPREFRRCKPRYFFRVARSR